jgi:hypothetical protein
MYDVAEITSIFNSVLTPSTFTRQELLGYFSEVTLHEFLSKSFKKSYSALHYLMDVDIMDYVLDMINWTNKYDFVSVNESGENILCRMLKMHPVYWPAIQVIIMHHRIPFYTLDYTVNILEIMRTQHELQNTAPLALRRFIMAQINQFPNRFFKLVHNTELLKYLDET